jgi:hypothetical protein
MRAIFIIPFTKSNKGVNLKVGKQKAHRTLKTKQ